MNVNLHLSGELEKFVNNLVEKGIAANKTEAIRFSVARYYEEYRKTENAIVNSMQQHTIEAGWNNPSDENASEFYRRKYLDG